MTTGARRHSELRNYRRVGPGGPPAGSSELRDERRVGPDRRPPQLVGPRPTVAVSAICHQPPVDASGRAPRGTGRRAGFTAALRFQSDRQFGRMRSLGGLHCSQQRGRRRHSATITCRVDLCLEGCLNNRPGAHLWINKRTQIQVRTQDFLAEGALLEWAHHTTE